MGTVNNTAMRSILCFKYGMEAHATKRVSLPRVWKPSYECDKTPAGISDYRTKVGVIVSMSISSRR